MCLQEFLNPFCEEVEKAFSQPNAGIQEIAGNLRLKHKKYLSCKLLYWVFAHLRELDPPSESESEKQFLPGAAFWYSRVNGSKRCIEKYLLLKPKRSYITERSSTCAFNLQS